MPDPIRIHTEADYVAAIPAHCGLQTLEAHVDMMLCWGVSNGFVTADPNYCDGCDLKVEEAK
jgi:hypothetical protein